MKFRLDPLSPNGVSVVNQTIVTGGGSSSGGGSSHDPVTVTGEDYLSLSNQQITANPIDLDNLSATGTPSASTFLRGDNTWATPAGSGDVSKVGTPVDGQVGVWTGDGTIEGDTALTFDTSTDTLSTGNIAVTGTVDGRDIASDGSKLDGIESGADVTDTTNVTSAGALMDSEVTNLAAVKAFDPTDYATAAQGGLADSAVQPGDNISDLNNDAGYTTNVGTVTSVAVSGSDGLEVDSGSPITTNGTVALGVNKTNMLSHLNVEDGADVTDATNVAAAGAVMESDTSTASMSFVIDEDDMSSNSATKVPTQQSVKAYVDANSGGGGSGDVVGPASSTDNAIALFDGTDGKLIQNSALTYDASTSTLSKSSGAFYITSGGATPYVDLAGGSLVATDGDASVAVDLAVGGSLQASRVQIPVAPGNGIETNVISESGSGAGVTIDGVLMKDGEVDGRDVASDGSKLDGIESGADVTDSTNVQAALPSGSNGQVLKHNGTSWAAGTDNNTTYSEISEANIENTASSTVGLITGRRAEALMDNEASKSRTLTNKTVDVDSNTVSNIEVDNFKASAIVTESEGINSSDNDTSLPTSAAVKDYVDDGQLYSTSETATNKKWVDGKTIYRKAVDCGAMPNATTKNVAHGITTIETLIRVYGSAKSGTTHLPLNYVNGLSAASSLGAYVSGANVVLVTGANWSSYSGYVTLEYTKV